MKPVDDEETPYIPAPIEHDFEPVSHPYEGSEEVGKVPTKKVLPAEPSKDDWKHEIDKIGANKWSKKEKNELIKNINGKPLSTCNKKELKEVYRQLKIENAKKLKKPYNL